MEVGDGAVSERGADAAASSRWWRSWRTPAGLMDKLYWHQSDLGGWAMYHVTQNAVLAKLFGVDGQPVGPAG